MKFGYDALGRRIFKHYKQTFTNFVWDGNVPLHEYKSFQTQDALTPPSGVGGLITWLFEEDSFSPIAKIKNDKHYSIINDHLGTPIEGYDDTGALIWERQLNANGKVLKETGIQNFCPFLYQGQSLDNEIELAYNRFRYYDVEDGRYISQDPIGLAGGLEFYGYVEDTNGWLDEFGLSGTFSATTWQAPSTGTGNNYTVYQQNIDWDLKDKKGRTNLERAQKGSAPKGADGKSINLHHSKQNSKGPLFEVQESTHRKYDRTNALHPHKVSGLGKHPHNKVNRKQFNKDRKQYWIDRANEESKRRNSYSK